LEDATHEFVWIPGDRVGAFNSAQFVAQLGRQQAAAAPRSVYVEPHVVFGANVRNWLNRIEGAQHCGAAGAVHVKGALVVCNALQD